MATQGQSKEGNLKELFAKTPAKKQEQKPRVASEGKGPSDGEQQEDDNTPIMMTLEEAESLPDMTVDLSRPPSGVLDRAPQEKVGGQGHKNRQREGRAHKPTNKESRKERADLLRSLRNQECTLDNEVEP
ncbi:hypothetical protein NDU88_006625 [Pleurodeles waltl]|uniref:Uncharacterized protein n=1 Tax=Pleurodeles waltl TaxID=8319 RepID=A0AAV7PLL0_PLEWA|nr:hypothetical protein NDU88_006625 [Pleurodeles waltl]